MRGEVGGDSPATLPVPARGWRLRAPSSLSFPFRSSCFCSGSKHGAGGGCCCPPRCAPPLPGFSSPCPGHVSSTNGPRCRAGKCPKSERAALQKCLDEERAGGGRRTGLELGGPPRGQPRGVCPRSGQLGQERARLCAARGPEQSICSCCFSYFYFYFWKGGSSGWSSVGCPSSPPRPGHPCGGTAPAPRGSNAVTACGRGELGLGAALPSPSPRSPPAPFGSPPPPPAPCLPLGASMQVLRCAGAAKGDGVCSPSNCVLKKKKSPPNSDLEVPRGAEPSGQELGRVQCRSFTWRGWGSGGAAGFGLIC